MIEHQGNKWSLDGREWKLGALAERAPAAMYQRPQGQSYSAYDAQDKYAPLPTYGGGKGKKKKVNDP